MDLSLSIRSAIEGREDRVVAEPRTYILKNNINLFHIISGMGPYHISEIKAANCARLIKIMNILLMDKYDSVADMLAAYDIDTGWLKKVVDSHLVPKKSTIHRIILESRMNPGYIWDVSPDPWID